MFGSLRRLGGRVLKYYWSFRCNIRRVLTQKMAKHSYRTKVKTARTSGALGEAKAGPSRRPGRNGDKHSSHHGED
jgi:hypothetical protein